MTMPASGARIALSDLQTVFGGVEPIKMDEYYQDASTGYTSGVTGIPNINSTISLNMFYGKAKPASALYSFTTHTFTNAGATGRNGPTISQVRSSYSSATWAQNASYLNMTTQGIQEWTVPKTGNYSLEVAGAAGGNGNWSGGKGARMIATFNLTKGTILAILVGQQGVVQESSCNSGGGGGTFVWDKSSTSQPLIVGGGGGGGGSGCGFIGLDAPTTINGTGGFGTSTPGSNGNGATPGGSGWLTNGTPGYNNHNNNNRRPLEGGFGGSRVSLSVGDGGFGGGASASGESCGNGGPGGGGGYSGGAGPSGDVICGSSGGGGSYNSGTNQTNTPGANTGHGNVTIIYLLPPSLPSLYSFTTHTFTNAGATGRNGPILSEVRAAYSSATWAQNASYLNMTTQGIQEWTVPKTGNYSLEVAGAAGGNGNWSGGKGARMIATFNLTKGTILAILVGQQGVVQESSCNSGGGGGTFVWDKSSTSQPLIVGGGGGGGGSGCGFIGLDAPTTINGTGGFGTSTPGSNGNGATPGGSGWLTNGTPGYNNHNNNNRRPLEGGFGGSRVSLSVGDGGFGGGASASGESCGNGGPGGGGGYSGGAGPSGDAVCDSSGGGGSYISNSGTDQTKTAGINTGHGYLIINYLSSTPTPPTTPDNTSYLSSIANLVLWHNGYNIDGSNNSTLSSGSEISSWYNSGSDSSLTTTQSTSSSRPTYTLNGAVFSSGKSLISNINLNLSTYTTMNIFIVWKKTQSSSGYKWLWSQDNGGYDRTLIINADSSLMIGRGDGGAEFPNYSFPINQTVIVNCEYNSPGQTGYFFINNTSLTTFSNLTASGDTTTEFGSNGGGSTSIDGIIHEILIINRILPTTERTNIYNALLAKY